MKNKDFAALAQLLLPELPGFAVKGPLMFIPPVGQTLRGLCFESHSHEEELFYVWVFFLPLFIPRKHVSFEFGKRVGGDRWNADAPDIVRDLGVALKREALPFLARIESPLDVAEVAKLQQVPQNPHVQQAIAYALARGGDVDEAVVALDELLRMVDVGVLWQKEIAERASTFRSQLLDNVASAQKQLEAWEVESARNLGLEKFR